MLKYLLFLLTSLAATSIANISYGYSPVSTCNPVAESACGLPFPSDLFASVNTGKLNFSNTILDKRVSGKVRPLFSLEAQFPPSFLPTEIFNDSHGYSPLGPILFELEAMPIETIPENGEGLLVVYDMATGETIDVVVSLSKVANTQREVRDRSAVIIAWPRTRFNFESTYVAILLKGLTGEVDGDTRPLEPSNGLKSVIKGSPNWFVSTAYKPVLAFVDEMGINRNDILSLTHFTVKPEIEVTGPLLKMTSTATQQVLAIKGIEEAGAVGSEDYGLSTLVGEVSLLNFRSQDGGVFEPYEPIASTTQDQAKFVLTIPRWEKSGLVPISIWGHGLFNDKTGTRNTYARNDDLGVATFAIDQPNHGTRVHNNITKNFSPHIATIPSSPKNMMQLLGMFVQTTVDQVAMLHIANSTLPDAVARFSDILPKLDKDRVVYQGLSFGAMVGATVGAVSPDTLGTYLSVGSGSLIQSFSKSTFWDGGISHIVPPNASGAEATFILAMMQHYVDIVDGVNFAHFYREPPDGLPPRALAMQYALDDGAIPNSAILAMAELVDLPLLKQVLDPQPQLPFGLEGHEGHQNGYGIIQSEFGLERVDQIVEQLKSFDNGLYSKLVNAVPDIDTNTGFSDDLNLADDLDIGSVLTDNVNIDAWLDQLTWEQRTTLKLLARFVGISPRQLGDLGGIGDLNEVNDFDRLAKLDISFLDNDLASIIDEIYEGDTQAFLTHFNTASLPSIIARINWHCEILALDQERCDFSIQKAIRQDAELQEKLENPELFGFSDLPGLSEADNLANELVSLVDDLSLDQLKVQVEPGSGGALDWLWAAMLSLLAVLRNMKGRLSRLYENAYIRTLGWSVAGAVVWGSWAFIANFNVPQMRVSAALSQAASSFFFTLIGIVLLEICYDFFAKAPFRAPLSVASVSGLSLTTMVSVHLLNGTPNIVITVIPVITVAVLFCSLYVYSLKT